MHVEAIWSCDVDGNPKDVFSKSVDDNYYWRVKVHNGDEQPVVGASVTSSVYRPGLYPVEPWKTFTLPTGTDGVASFVRQVKNNDLVGIYTLDVDDIVKSGMTYDPNADEQDIDTFEVVN
jgi:hypothetical protein